jgi:hypothetical protein
MSFNIIKKNTGSPFHLQRSMVDQGGEGGAYESGGYDPSNVYSDSGISSAISGFGTVLAAGISSRTAADDNASNVNKKERLDKKTARLTKKMISSKDEKQASRIEKRLGNIGEKKQKTETKIKAYNEIEKPTLKSDIGKKETPVTVNSKIPQEEK